MYIFLFFSVSACTMFFISQHQKTGSLDYLFLSFFGLVLSSFLTMSSGWWSDIFALSAYFATFR